MTQKATTPDERFLIAVHQAAVKAGNPLQPVNRLSVARSIGMKEIALKNIVKHLAQANLLKKLGEESVQLTSRGLLLVLDILGLHERE